MFLTGPAGSGKRTAMRVAEQFCYEFCVAVGVMWCESTFLFTAYTRSAALLFGGVTISKAAYINQQKHLSADDINEWKDGKILMIDEVSIISNRNLITLNNRLIEIGNRTTSFGGLSNIFACDFHQLEPICLNESDLMFSSLSLMFWQRIINAIIILDNDHCFKEDPEYRKMLKKGDITHEDRERINTRVIGHDGLELPSMLKGKYQIILCKNNTSFLNLILF